MFLCFEEVTRWHQHAFANTIPSLATCASGPDPHTYRSQLCTLLRREKALQEWYALIVLYITEWPTNARRGNGGDAFIDSLRNLAKNFKAPRHATMHVQLMFADETTCGTPSFFLEGVRRISGLTHEFVFAFFLI